MDMEYNMNGLKIQILHATVHVLYMNIQKRTLREQRLP